MDLEAQAPFCVGTSGKCSMRRPPVHGGPGFRKQHPGEPARPYLAGTKDWRGMGCVDPRWRRQDLVAEVAEERWAWRG